MKKNYDLSLRLDVPVPMRDGVSLSTDLYLPSAAGSFPTVLIRTPYGNATDGLAAKGRALANMGYSCAIQDCRGRWDSEGSFAPFIDEGEDGFDTCEWLSQQSWCNGNIGTMGGSYLGWVQWAVATAGSKHLKCVAPSVIGTDMYSMIRPGGALLLNTALTWAMGTDGRTAQNVRDRNWTEIFRELPLTQAAERAGQHIPYFADWVEHEARDEYWNEFDLRDRAKDIQIPALITTGWYDLFAPRTLADYATLRSTDASTAAQQSRLVVGPWVHAISSSHRVGEIDFGLHSLQDLDLLHWEWFERQLNGNSHADGAPVKLFVMGINQWRDEETWPLPGAVVQRWFLHSKGKANTVHGDGVLSPDQPSSEPPDEFTYDPQFPVQTIGGANCCDPNIVPWGPYDQRPVEMRSDVLCYTSAPLTKDLTVIGAIQAIIYAATDAVDTDWTVKLIDVWPSGYAMLLSDGIVRARFRNGCEAPALIEPGNMLEYHIDVGCTGNAFREGHQIRVEISSSNFPRYDRNLNTGLPVGAEQNPLIARQTVFHEPGRESCILLPVVGD